MRQMGVKVLMFAAVLTLLTACSGLIYDDEGDCTVSYKLKFRYDMNMKFADAFANEVKSVRLYAFDKDGLLVWQKSEKGSALAAEGYAMELDLQPGAYHLVAWCGLDNDGTRGESFTVTDMTVGSSRLDDLQCRLNREHDEDGTAYVDTDLYALFHGSMDVELPDGGDDGGIITYTMPLTKDTNHLRVILQQLSGADLDVSNYTFTLEDANGLMAYDNSLLTDESIVFKAWNTESGTAGVDSDSSDETITQVKAAIADLTVPRLIEGHDMYLTIRNADGETIVRVPFIDYALLIKGNYNGDMSNQEYLDRQDEYSMTFFLDEKDRWEDTYIYINSWRIVLSNNDLGN